MSMDLSNSQEVVGYSYNESRTVTLNTVVEYMKSVLTNEILQELISKLNAIRIAFTGDGAGLSGGILADKFVVEFFSSRIGGFIAHHIGESDCKIIEHPISMKKIHGKSTIALDWSKNGENSKERERFCTDIMIINLKTEQWWKTAPVSANQNEIESNLFSKIIKAGIYFIPNSYCRTNINLKSNNKTNSLIESIQLYKMLLHSIEEKMVIEFPSEFPLSTFNILRAFD
jgi:hypothetical protein